MLKRPARLVACRQQLRKRSRKCAQLRVAAYVSSMALCAVAMGIAPLTVLTPFLRPLDVFAPSRLPCLGCSCWALWRGVGMWARWWGPLCWCGRLSKNLAARALGLQRLPALLGRNARVCLAQLRGLDQKRTGQGKNGRHRTGPQGRHPEGWTSRPERARRRPTVTEGDSLSPSGFEPGDIHPGASCLVCACPLLSDTTRGLGHRRVSLSLLLTAGPSASVSIP